MASKASSRVLTDHEEIQRWAEERGAKPAAVRGTGSDDDPGIIRLDFPGYSGEGSLEEMDWDEWFEKFDENNLALVVQEETANGQRSNFNKLVSRDSIEQSSSKKKSSAERGAAGGNAKRRARTTQSSNASSRSSKKKAGASGSRTSQASGESKQSGRSSRGASSRESKSSGRRAA
jgi:hypothetical protein